MRNNISDHYKDQLLDCLFHYMDPSLRGLVINEVPAAYNAYVQSDVARVVRWSDGTRFASPSPRHANSVTGEKQ